MYVPIYSFLSFLVCLRLLIDCFFRKGSRKNWSNRDGRRLSEVYSVLGRVNRLVREYDRLPHVRRCVPSPWFPVLQIDRLSDDAWKQVAQRIDSWLCVSMDNLAKINNKLYTWFSWNFSASKSYNSAYNVHRPRISVADFRYYQLRAHIRKRYVLVILLADSKYSKKYANSYFYRDI